jgi:hypothetical protein
MAIYDQLSRLLACVEVQLDHTVFAQLYRQIFRQITFAFSFVFPLVGVHFLLRLTRIPQNPLWIT